ncbi:DeoR/GlpR family DNA-binding transcription regulator [Fodinicola acaciae]|uniref:DeoR/GlpR family DNA-binding transcription regulator n=1 Tax=Fodinicola acaciae TaxID=2681555 RepID=UPI0013D5658B|nr:DeoR/GlpR family DNA-binding transcription regulator [Fodinicola acaciae]
MDAQKPASARRARQEMIARYVLDHESATANELADLTGVSLMTVHRDLEDLSRQGIVRKFRGGVSAQPSSVFESNIEFRLQSRQAEKAAMARVARQHVEAGMAVMLDDATSTLAVARLLGDVSPLTVVTNYIGAIDVLRKMPDIRLIALGGEYSHTHDSFGGVGCIDAISQLTVDVVFVSTSAMTHEMAYHQEQEIVLTKRAMLRAAHTRILLMDSQKIGRRALHQLCPLTDFDLLIVDSGIKEDQLADIRDGGVTVEVASL